jgi:pyruvate dehydrogenase E1 component alpha subunit
MSASIVIANLESEEASLMAVRRPQEPEPQAEDLRTLLYELYRQMHLIRRFEEVAAKAYAQGKMGGFLHLYIGQEPVGVGAISALAKDDYIIAAYREHGHALARGMTSRALMAELFGKVTGCSKGRGGSMHLFDVDIGFLGGHAIVGGHCPLAAGTAFASKYRNDGRVTLCLFGDGSASQGAFHEALSLASLWKLPVVFLCENNLYSMGTPLYRSLAVDDVSIKAITYGMARDRFDGTDVLEVRRRVKAAVDRARYDSTPTLIEVRTYRLRGHSMADPGKYRSKEEVEEYKRRDGIAHARRRLVTEFGYDEKQLADLDESIEAEVQDALEFAESSPQPDVADLSKYVYSDGEGG